jgi:hypothetical protein
MPTSVYISQGYRNEQLLYEDLVIESIKNFGQDVYYLPRNIVIRDGVLNEDIESSFTDAYAIEMYLESTDGFEGEGNILTKFGLEIREQANLIVAKRRWNQLVGTWNNEIDGVRPKEGDLIYIPFSKTLFEIRYVEYKVPFYQLQNLPVYRLECELFEYRSEKIDTGIPELDVYEQLYAASTTFQISGGTKSFIAGESISQRFGDTASGFVTITGEVASFERDATNGSLANLKVVGIVSDDADHVGFELGSIYSNDNTNTAWSITKIYGINDGDDLNIGNDSFTQNSFFETRSDDIIDFSESNPFGEIS